MSFDTLKSPSQKNTCIFVLISLKILEYMRSNFKIYILVNMTSTYLFKNLKVINKNKIIT